jgi:Tfp pilus assembly protein PilF
MQSLHDGNWGQTEASLRRAISLDPSMTTAHLRLALVLATPRATVEARKHYALAASGRQALSERDQAVLLYALEPWISYEPTDPLLRHPAAA